MAEGWARALLGGQAEFESAGIAAHGMNPDALAVMAEAGVDIGGQWSKTLQALLDGGAAFDAVVTVCGHADENCPAMPGHPLVVHRGFDDPPKLARDAASREEALGHYRRVRDEIRAFIEAMPSHPELGAVLRKDISP